MKNKKLILGILAVAILISGVLGYGYWEKQSGMRFEWFQTGNTIVVTSTADSGPDTLRQALLDAQSGDTIVFDPEVFPPQAQATILLTSELPIINQGYLTIDASNAGVILDGKEILEVDANCFNVNSEGNIIQGLQFVNFASRGIGLYTGARNNTIGGDRGTGSGPFGQGNLFIRNGGGICFEHEDASFNTITGNLIGTDAAGADDPGNIYEGILINNNASYNIIGPDNIIAYNGRDGIAVYNPGSLGNTITQNSIHHNGDSEWSGINLWEGGNALLFAPIITDFDLATGMVMGFTCPNCIVEVFSDSGDGGEVYECQTTSNEFGAFTFNKGASFAGPHLTATTTDSGGNTSEFSIATSGTSKSSVIQEGNNLPRTQLQPKQSNELEDNRIGIHFSHLWHPEYDPEVFPHLVLDTKYIFELGLKRVRLAINDVDSYRVEWSKPEFSIDPSHDDFITGIADNGITITYILSFWDKEYVAQGGEVQYPRFKTEEEIQRYLDFVQFTVHHFKDRIQYYEIWNEPNIEDTIQWIEVDDYINLVERAVPVIREEYPEAKIVVGSTSSLIDQESQEYLFTILKSDIMPLVDVVEWHPMYGSSPEYDWHREYYYEYPSIIQEIKDVASAHGFRGEYVADEIHWCTPDQPEPPWPTYTETKSAKYLARGIVMHLGMDVTVSHILLRDKPLTFHTVQNLCTVMAGAEAINLSIGIQSEATNIENYSFSLPNGDKLIALWTDGVAVDNDPGVKATVTIPNYSAQEVMGIDVLNGYQQPLTICNENNNLIIQNLIVRDYPLILRIKKEV